MPKNVDPKNASQRETREWGVVDRLQGLLPGRFYLRESLAVLAILLVGYVIYDFSQFVETNKQYRTTVRIQGLEALSRGTVLGEIDHLVGSSENPRSLVNVSVDRVRSTLTERIPRFKSVSVRKEYPDRLIIAVEERTPVALIARRNQKGESEIFLPIDREGVIFRPTEKEIDTLPGKVPVVKGFPEVEQGTPSFDRKWKKALKVLDIVDRQFSSDLLEWVQVRTGGYIQIRINHPKPLNVRLGESRYARKLEKLKQMMQTNQFLDIKKYVNLTQLKNVRAL